MGKPWGNEYLGKEAVKKPGGPCVPYKSSKGSGLYIYLCKVAVGKGSLKGHGYLGKVAGKGLYKAGEEVGQWGLEDVASTMDHIID